jgi:hypothetical protein
MLPYFVDFTSDTLFYQLFTIPVRGKGNMSNIHTFSEDVALTVEHLANEFVPIPPIANDWYIITEASQTYQTAFINHHVVHMNRRVGQYAQLRLGKNVWNKLRNRKIAFALTRYITCDSDDRPDDELLESDWVWLEDVRSRYMAYKTQRVGVKETASSMKAAVEFTYFLGKRVEEWKLLRKSEQDDSSVKEYRDDEGQEPASFSIAPICQIKQHFIVITRTTLETYFKSSAASYIRDMLADKDHVTGALTQGLRRKKGDQDDFSWWNAIFKDDTFKHRSLRRGWRFDDRMLTDGISLCVAFRNTEQPSCTKTRFKKKTCQCYDCRKCCWDADFSSERVVAVDPGDINLVYAVEKDPRGNVTSYKLRNKEVYMRANMYKRSKIMRKHLLRGSELFAELSSKCRKTVCYERHLEYWKYCLTHHDALWKRMYIKIRARMGLEVYRRKASVLDKFWMSIQNAQKRKPLVAYGSGGGNNFSYQGRVSPPTSYTWKSCRKVNNQVFIVPEWYTSQYCPYCHVKLIDVVIKQVDSKGFTRNKVLRSVKRCSSSECVERGKKHHCSKVRKLAIDEGLCEMSRDEIGALNILMCGIATIHEQPRPEHLTFSYNHR